MAVVLRSRHRPLPMSDLSALPTRIPAGTSVAYTRSYSEYPASDGWVLTLHLAFPTALAIEATADGDSFALELATDDLDVAAGVYHWAERVSKSEETYQVAAGLVEITPDLATAAAATLATWAETALPLVEAALARALTTGFASVQVGTHAYTNVTPEELRRIRRQLLDEIRTHRNPARQGRTFHARF